MKATLEKLCRLLDERGVEYEGNERWVRWRDRNGVMMQAVQLANGELWMGVWSCTPEQAIAATLESDGEYERKMDSLLCRLTNGLFSKTRAYSLDFMESCIEEAFEAGNACQTSTTHAVIVSDESTDCATGHCECELCGQPIDPWDRFCRHCGAEVVTDG